MSEPVCLVTGANAGLGKASALALAKSGATIVLLCRDKGRGEAARADVAAASGNPNVELLLAELSVQASVRAAAAEFLSRHAQLDVLVNNAAVFMRERVETADGLETMFAANYLGHFLLTNLLLDALKVSPAGRIIHVSAPTTTRVSFDDLGVNRDFRPLLVFGISKMCNLLFGYGLARRLKDTPVTSNVLHPGLVKTGLMGGAPWIIRTLPNLFAKTPEQAAEAVRYLALSPEVAGVTGRFFKGKQAAESAAYSRDSQIQDQLWESSLRLAHLETTQSV
jgi:NAD(P)-dependent dehydrogenase (short-subunit alcohol dehydrogenase family)